jgi:two-component system copper resistance phosphate regulon response regulator CusR
MDLLVIEDDAKVQHALKKGLAEAGFPVTTASSAERAFQYLNMTRPDLVVLDLGLPGEDGFAVLRHVRKQYGALPVIILTARDTVDERVAGLDAGADDYLVKPFALPELLARIRVRLRSPGEAATLRVGNVKIDPRAGTAKCGDALLDLTPLEFSILRCLVSHTGTIVTREMLANDVWHLSSRSTPIDNIVHVHLSHLRSKLRDEASHVTIETVRGLGYRLEATQ